MSDEQDQWEALAALLTTTDLGANVYDYETVPGEVGNPDTLPDFYAILSVERRYNGNGTTCTGWRASVRFVARSSENARIVGGWVRSAFEVSPGRGKRITVDGIESTPITHESSTAVAADDGVFSGLSSWTFAL